MSRQGAHSSSIFSRRLERRLDPSQNGGVYDRDAALRHQVAHVAITQLVSDIPSHGLNEKEMFEVAAFEECGILGRCSFALRTTWHEKK
jgi:hypothetical protein